LKNSLGAPATNVLDKTDQMMPWSFLLLVVLVIPLVAATGLLLSQRKQAQI